MKNEFSSYFGRTHKLFAFIAAACFSGLMLAHPALAEDVTVASPINGTSVESPIWVRAHNVGCNGLTPTEFGFSIDNSGAVTRGASANDVDVINVGLPAGPHTIHFKSSTANGECPVVNTTFNVVRQLFGQHLQRLERHCKRPCKRRGNCFDSIERD